MKIFFLGGSFDPPHLGHFKIAEKFLKKCDLFLFIPAKRSPFKKNNPIASPSQRLRMLSFSRFISSKIKIETFELKSKNPSYSYLTIEYLKRKYNPKELNMIIGRDNLNGLINWKNSKFIFQNCNIICLERDSINESYSKKYKNISFYKFDKKISSSNIRKLFKDNIKSQWKKLLDQKVLDFIIKNKIYIKNIY